MAVVDVTSKTIVVKIVYYGCALGGKTTNLQTLHRLTDPDGRQGLVSLATNDDRTLFFDLLPMELGQIGGLGVKIKLYTVPGQMHYELTRRKVLAGADGVVFVADSSPQARKANQWAVENLRFNMRQNGLDPDTTPTILQWNKRDLPDAMPRDVMQSELNPRGLPAVEAIAMTGSGVVETFVAVLERALLATYTRAGRSVGADQISATVSRALADARQREPTLERTVAPLFDRRFDMDAYREEQAGWASVRSVVDQESLLGESVQTSMMLAEKLEGLRESQALSVRRGEMMDALSRLAPLLSDPRGEVLPPGVMASLLAGCRRGGGALFLAGGPAGALVEREVVPAGRDPLNDIVSEGLGSIGQRLALSPTQRVVEDLATELFFGQVPETLQDLAALLVTPIACDGLHLGAMFVYGRHSEDPFDTVEQEYWATVATFAGLSLHWRALRRKLEVQVT